MTKRQTELSETEFWLLHTILKPMDYGEVVVRVQAGEIVHVDRKEGLKPPEKVGQRRVVR